MTNQTRRTARVRRSSNSVRPWSITITHGLLVLYSIIAIAPVLIVVVNSFKTGPAIFDDPFALPTVDTFTLSGYERATTEGDFGLYFANSLIVTLASLLITVALAALAGFGISEYSTRVTPLVLLFFAAGIMLPIRLGTVSLLNLMSSWGLVNTHLSLILVYVAMSLPLAVILMAQFMSQTSKEMKEAARIDGAHELYVFGMTVPLVRPALAAVGTVTMLPIWNDLWFPLILAPSRATSTVTLGIQQFVGQYTTDWGAVLAALTLSALPLVIVFVIFSRQFVDGLTAGIGK